MLAKREKSIPRRGTLPKLPSLKPWNPAMVTMATASIPRFLHTPPYTSYPSRKPLVAPSPSPPKPLYLCSIPLPSPFLLSHSLSCPLKAHTHMYAFVYYHAIRWKCTLPDSIPCRRHSISTCDINYLTTYYTIFKYSLYDVLGFELMTSNLNNNSSSNIFVADQFHVDIKIDENFKISKNSFVFFLFA